MVVKLIEYLYSKMNHMKLSIITINYNNVSGLDKTMQSVISQSFTDFEYFIDVQRFYWRVLGIVCSESDNNLKKSNIGG